MGIKTKIKKTGPAKGFKRLQLDLADGIVDQIDRSSSLIKETVRKPLTEKVITMLFSYSKIFEVLEAAKVEQLKRELQERIKG